MWRRIGSSTSSLSSMRRIRRLCHRPADFSESKLAKKIVPSSSFSVYLPPLNGQAIVVRFGFGGIVVFCHKKALFLVSALFQRL